jgi:hypothetical protein
MKMGLSAARSSRSDQDDSRHSELNREVVDRVYRIRRSRVQVPSALQRNTLIRDFIAQVTKLLQEVRGGTAGVADRSTMKSRAPSSVRERCASMPDPTW